MTQEEALQDFFKSLKITLNNSSIYFQTHPLFIKSAEDLKEKINRLFHFINPIKIGITCASLLVDEKSLKNAILFEGLAHFFHFRKIKSIEIKDTLSMAELTYFLSKVSRPPREIFKEGGLDYILEKQKITSLAVESLDYSQLLNAEGEEYKDIWIYLFQDVIEKKDVQKINQLTENFARVLGKFKSDDLLKDEELRQNLLKFLDYLKNTEEDKFYKCSKEIVKQIVRSKEIPQDRIEKLRTFFKDLHAETIADTLWQEIIADENFDHLSFNVFINLVDKKQESEITACLAQKASGADSLQITPAKRKKIKELLLAQDSQAIPEVYRHALASIFEVRDLEKAEYTNALDGARVHINYRFLMLNVLYEEKNKTRLAVILEKILDEWDAILKDKDFEFMRRFLEILKGKERDSVFAQTFKPLKKHILNFIETIALEEGTLPHFEYFLNFLTESSLTLDDYLNKIFIEQKVNPSILQLFLKFFPENIATFNAYLRRRISDFDFLRKMAESLKTSDSPLALIILKYIFSFSHLLVKIEVLKAMHELSLRDKEFLFSILKSRDVPLKKEALTLLINDKNAQNYALEILLNIPSPLGVRNNILEENIKIIAQEKASAEALRYLAVLSKRRFFWNRNIRKTAHEALEKLNA